MRVKWVFKRYIIFVVILLLVMPLILSLFINAADYEYNLRAVFLLQKFYIIFSALLLMLFIASYHKIKDYEPKPALKNRLLRNKGNKGTKKEIRRTIFFAALSIIFFALAFSTQLNYDKILSEGVGVDSHVNFDASRWLAPGILSDADVIKDKSNVLNDNSEKLMREVMLASIPEHPVVAWNGYWQDRNGDGKLENCSILLEVNNRAFDVAPLFNQVVQGRKSWMSIEVAKDDLVIGNNNLTFSKQCPDSVAITSQTTYINGQTFEFKGNPGNPGNSWSSPPFDELVLYIKQDSGIWFHILFKLGFIFRVVAVVLLFISIFGVGFIIFLFRKAKLELAFSFIYALFMYWFANWIRNYWLLLSKLVTYATYSLLWMSFLKPVMDFSTPLLPFLGAKDFILGIADTCSGIESIGYFVLAYSALILINWNRIDFKKALLLFIPGLVGTFVVNILRVYLIFIIGLFVSRSFAVNIFHTNAGMILFILYFVFFWLFAMKIMEKKERKSKNPKSKTKNFK